MSYELNLDAVDRDGAIAQTHPTGAEIAPNGPFDTPYTAGKVLAAVKATGFIG